MYCIELIGGIFCLQLKFFFAVYFICFFLFFLVGTRKNGLYGVMYYH